MNPQVGDFYFADQEKLSECCFYCQHKTFSVICSVVIRLFLKAVECTLRTHASGENMTNKSEQILWSLLVKLRIFFMNSSIVISVRGSLRSS